LRAVAKRRMPAPLGAGRLQRRRGVSVEGRPDCRAGRDPVVCQRAIRAGAAPASVARQRRPANCCIRARQQPSRQQRDDRAAIASACGCRIKPFEKTRGTHAEVHFRAAVHDVLATSRLRATDEMAVFGTHPYKRSSVLARGFPTATPEGSRLRAEARAAEIDEEEKYAIGELLLHECECAHLDPIVCPLALLSGPSRHCRRPRVRALRRLNPGGRDSARSEDYQPRGPFRSG
jgi:hypothetical protein